MSEAPNGSVTFGQVAQVVNSWGLSDLMALQALVATRISLLSTRATRPLPANTHLARRVGTGGNAPNRRVTTTARPRPSRGPAITASQFDHVAEYKAYQQANKAIAKLIRENRVSGLAGLRAANLPAAADALQQYDEALANWVAWKQQYYTAHPERRPPPPQRRAEAASAPSGDGAPIPTDGGQQVQAPASSAPTRNPRRRNRGARDASGNPRPRTTQRAARS